MAMNKKEQAEMAALKRQLTVASAFVRTPVVAKDVMPPEFGEEIGYAYGFDFNSNSKVVREYWSGSVSHHTQNPESKNGYMSGGKGGRYLYSTRLLALKALRHEVENEAAESLAKIDMQIAAEIQAQKEQK